MYRADDMMQQLIVTYNVAGMVTNKLWHIICKLFSSEDTFIDKKMNHEILNLSS